MKRYEWSSWTDANAAKRRAGGRRRYNAQRRRLAWERRAAIAAWLDDNSEAMLFSRGLPGTLAPVFGVHPTTIWRDLQFLLYGGRTTNYWRDGEFLFSVTREYPGGPVNSIEDEGGNEIRGEARKRIIKSLPRYCG